jgi:chromosomal replication initiation ATPase DnaA
MNILRGITSGIVSGNEAKVQVVTSWLPGTYVEVALSAVVDAEKQYERAKLELSSAKKQLARAFRDWSPLILDERLLNADYYGLREGDLLKRSKKTERQRRTGVYLSKVMSCRKNADIGVVFGITIQAVTNAVREVEKRKEADRRFNSELMRIKKIIGEPR